VRRDGRSSDLRQSCDKRAHPRALFDVYFNSGIFANSSWCTNFRRRRFASHSTRVPPRARVQSVRRAVECQDRERTSPWRGSPGSTVPSPIEGVAPVSVAVKAEPAILVS
jgi:hypothetical protein